MTNIRVTSLWVSVAVYAAALLFLFVACGSDPAPTEAPDAPPTSASSAPSSPQAATNTPSPTATPTPVPTPTETAEEQLGRVMMIVADKLEAMTSATFDMVDETESGAPFFGTTFKSLSGQVKTPDSFWMVVKVVAPGFGFVEIEMTAVGEDAFIKFSEGAPWTPLPVDEVPFNFGGIGPALSGLVTELNDPQWISPETLGDTRTIGFEGTVSSEGTADLIIGVDPGHTVTLTFWVDEVDHSLRQLRIAGKLFDDDGPETIRMLDITGINVDVDIQLPESTTQQ